MDRQEIEWPAVTADDAWAMLQSIADFALELMDFTPWEQAAYTRSYLHSFRRIAVAGYLEDPLVLNCAGLSMREVWQLKTHLEILAANK